CSVAIDLVRRVARRLMKAEQPRTALVENGAAGADRGKADPRRREAEFILPEQDQVVCERHYEHLRLGTPILLNVTVASRLRRTMRGSGSAGAARPSVSQDIVHDVCAVLARAEVVSLE